MEIKIGTKQILNILHVLSWIIFIGVCIEAGEILFKTFYTMQINPTAAKKFLEHADLSHLYTFDHGQFLVMASIMSIVAMMRGYLFYLIVTFLYDKKLNMAQPFNKDTSRFVFNLSHLSLLIGLFSFYGVNYGVWLESKNIFMPDSESMRLGGADVWLFMSVILFVIAHIFKRGIEIQNENDLTV